MIPVPADIPHTPMTQECFMAEAARQNLSPELLLAVIRQENGKHGQVRQNKDGSWDISYMQINTVHLAEFAKLTNRSQRDVLYLLAYNGCANVAAGAYLLRRRINEANGDIWKGVARYHSKTPSKGPRYAWKVYEKLIEIRQMAGRYAPEQIAHTGSR